MGYTNTLLLIACTSFIFAQKGNTEYEQVLENLKLELTIDSYDDIKEINISDIKYIFSQSKRNQPIEFKIYCNNASSINTALVTNLSFKVNGCSNYTGIFIKKIRAIKKNIKKYYNNQKSNK